MRKIALVTVARSDYGIYRPILKRLQADPEFKLQVVAAGMHLEQEFGMTVDTVEKDGFSVAARVPLDLTTDTPAGIARSMGLGVQGYASAYEKLRPDILVVLGDRFEMHAAALAALPFKIPVAHIHGGEVTEAAIDDALRHSITKLSHLHFTTTAEYGRRVVQLGEAPWRVHVVGAPGLDNIREVSLLDASQLGKVFGIRVDPPPLLVTFHAVTLHHEDTPRHVDELLAALAESGLPTIFTLPNSDTGGRIIRDRLRDFVRANAQAQMVDNFGTQGYLSMMALAAAMVGNSSSGIIEAASFKLPVVNIGDRQAGRVRARNVLDVGYDRASILEGIRKAVSPAFRASLGNLQNPYGDGHAAERIVALLKSVTIDDRLLIKRFHDLGSADGVAGEKSSHG